MKLFNRLQTILIIIIFQRIAKPIDTNSIPFIYHPLNSRYQSQRIFYSPDRCHTQQPQYFFFPEQRIVWIKTIQIYKIGNRNQFLPQCRNIPGNKIALCMRIRNYIIAKRISNVSSNPIFASNSFPKQSNEIFCLPNGSNKLTYWLLPYKK